MSHEGTQICGKLVMETGVNVATRRGVDPRNSTNNNWQPRQKYRVRRRKEWHDKVWLLSSPCEALGFLQA
jgi:hypothetical protein